MTVESYAKEVFKKEGYNVFKGSDVNLFFSVLSYNFEDSFFFQVSKNYLGNGAEYQLAQLDAAVQESLRQSLVSSRLLDLAEAFFMRYYSTYEPKRRIHRDLTQELRQANAGILINIVRVYRSMGYTIKGVPDLFLIRNGEFKFVEVKSEKDALRPEQYEYFERFIRVVGPNVELLRILPRKGDEEQQYTEIGPT